MTPAIHRLLRALAGRERSLATAWAAGRAAAVCLAALVVCLSIDWLIDRWGQTPLAVHVVLLGVQVLVWAGAAVFTVLPAFTLHGGDDLALKAEEAVPSLGHRLISAVQLNRKGAKTAGMSAELIAATTAQAERRAAEVDPAAVIPGERYRWAALAAGPALAVVALLFAVMPGTAMALLNRMFLGGAEIPRRVGLTAQAAPVWPANEEVTLKFDVTGLWANERPDGHVRITPEAGPAFTWPLTHDAEADVYVAKLPPSDIPFTYTAFLVDGRTKTPGRVDYSPRPVAQSVQAWVKVPLTLAKKKDGTAYEEAQKGGDIVWRVPGSSGRIRVTTQTPVERCSVKLGRRQVDLAVVEGGMAAEGDVPLEVEKGVYEIHLLCPHGFANVEIARRSVRRLPLDPPEVALLPETTYRMGDLGTPEEREVEGIPVLEGERFRVDYRATARYGLERPRIRFRVVPQSKGDEGQDKVDPDRFLTLPLGPVKGVPPSEAAKDEFRAKEAGPDALPDSEATGTYHFAIAGIPDGEGGRIKLKKGDRIQFFVEVHSKADPDGRPGRSAIREKEVVDVQALLTWLERKEDLKERTRALEEAARTSRPGGSP